MTKAGRSPGNDDEVSTFNSLPNILLHGWEGLKAYTFEIRQSIKVHTLEKFSAVLCAAKLLLIFLPRFVWCSMASTLQICYLTSTRHQSHDRCSQAFPDAHGC